MTCRKCNGLLYEDTPDRLFKCYQCGTCYYMDSPQPVPQPVKGPMGMRVTYGGRPSMVKG